MDHRGVGKGGGAIPRFCGVLLFLGCCFLVGGISMHFLLVIKCQGSENRKLTGGRFGYDPR